MRAVLGVRRPVAVGEERGLQRRDGREDEHGAGAGHPPELRDAPRQRQHAGPDHRRDHVRRRRPHAPCMSPTPGTETETAGSRQ